MRREKNNSGHRRDAFASETGDYPYEYPHDCDCRDDVDDDVSRRRSGRECAALDQPGRCPHAGPDGAERRPDQQHERSDLRSDFKEQVKSIKEVKIIDDHKVQFLTDGPNPILPNEITNLYMMDKGWAEKNNVLEPQDFAAGEETFAVRNANGTGPFIVDQRLPDELTVLVKNPNWWGAASAEHNIDKIEYRPIKNAATRVAALLSGEVDFVLDPPLQDLKRIDASDGLKTVTVNQIRTIFFGMDQGVDELRNSDVKGKNPFKDKRVRQAFYQSLDVEAIQRVVMEGLSFPAGIITSPGVHGFTKELDKRRPFDPAAAKKLLADAGYPDGFTVQLQQRREDLSGGGGHAGQDRRDGEARRHPEEPAFPENQKPGQRLLHVGLGRADARFPLCLQLPVA